MKRHVPEGYGMQEPRHQTPQDRAFARRLDAYWGRSLGTNVDKLRAFPKYVPRQSLAQFLARSALFDYAVGIHGHLVECGVYLGAGLMTWAQLSAIHEPYNHIRRIVGFDTFTGFVGLVDKDRASAPRYAKRGGLAVPAARDLRSCLRLYDSNRPIGHIPRVELQVGDAARTIPDYVKTHPHLVVALLHLDFDLYEPTRVALETLLPRMPKGAVLAFDELNQAAWPGETLAVLEAVGLRSLRIRRFPYTPQLSFAVLE